MKTAINNVPSTPLASGPYSPGIIAEGRFLFISGQGPWDPVRGAYIRGSIEEQTELTLRVIERIAYAAGAMMEDTVSVRVFLQQLTEKNFASMNSVYSRFFGPTPPARSTIGAQLLNIDVEIDAIIALPHTR